MTTRQEGEGERVVADFSDRDGAPIAGLDVVARFVHPFDRSADREATSSTPTGAAYEGVAAPLHAGRWTLVIEAQAGRRAEVHAARTRSRSRETAVGD